MGVLDRMFKRSAASDRHQAQTSPPQAQPECAHLAMTPRWDSLEDMGHEDRATSFVCDSCHATLTPADAELARVEAANRIRIE